MLLLEKLQTTSFSDSQQAVINFILEHKNQVGDMTIRQIARASFTSNATLIRIAHKLGYSGWDEFKEDFLKEQTYLASHFSSIDPNLPFDRRDSIRSIMSKVAELKKESIKDTLQLLEEKDLLKAAQILRKSRLVNLLALNNTRILAESFALKLGRIQKRADVPDLNGEARYSRILFEKDSCAVVISYSGETDALVRDLEAMHKAGIPIIAITSIGESTLTKNADVILRICTREKMYSKISWFTSETAIEYVLDLLYSALFWLDYESNLKNKLEIARSLEHERTASSHIINEHEKAPE